MLWKRIFLVAILALSSVATQAEAGSWLIDANAGLGVPIGDFGDFWSSGLLLGARVGYMSEPFEIGADFSYLQNDPSDDYEAVLQSINADDEFRFVQYGVHARWMAPVQGKASPYLGVGLGAYSMKEDYDEPGFSEELSSTVLGVSGMAGLNYWIGPTWGLGLDIGYHNPFPDEDEIGHDKASYWAFTGGFRWNLGTSR